MRIIKAFSYRFHINCFWFLLEMGKTLLESIPNIVNRMEKNDNEISIIKHDLENLT